MKNFILLLITVLFFVISGFSQETETADKTSDSTLVVIEGQEALIAYNEGIELYKSGNYEQAIQKYTEAIDFDSAYAKAYLNRGRAKRKLEQFRISLSGTL